VAKRVDGTGIGSRGEALTDRGAQVGKGGAQVAHGSGEVVIGSGSIMGENERPRPGFRAGSAGPASATPVSW
jgi:hypothetical protein